MAVARGTEGKKAGEKVGASEKLTTGSIWVEGCRKEEVDVRGRSSGEAPMVDGSGEGDSSLGRGQSACICLEEVEDEVAGFKGTHNLGGAARDGQRDAGGISAPCYRVEMAD